MRVFVAIEISNDDVISSIIDFQSKVKINAKPVISKNLHFTLQFLGEISEDEVENIRQALRLIKFSPFKIKFKGIGAFPNIKSPRVIWIGTDQDGANFLKNLAGKVENLLSPLGFTSDKPFKSHLTVFRIKNKAGEISKELKKFEFADFGSQEISNIKLKQSILTPKGPLYSDIEVITAQ
jgi:2'-5' RNA ligase